MLTSRFATQWRRTLVLARGHHRATALLLGLTLLCGGLGAVEPLLLKRIFDALTGGSADAALLSVGLLLGLGLGKELVSGFVNWLSWRTRLRVHYQLLDASITHLHALSLRFHARHSVGAVMTKLDRSIQGLVGALTEFLFNVLPSLVYLGVAIAIMIRIDWRLAIAVLLFVPLPAAISFWAAREQTEREKNLLNRWARIYSRFNEVLHGILTVKSFAMEEKERMRFLVDVEDANEVVVRGVARDSRVTAAKNMVTVLSTAAAIGLGALLVMRGETTAGTIVAFLGYLHGLFGPVQGLTSTYQTMRKASVSLEALYEILDEKDLIADAPHAIELDDVNGDVELKDLCFSYDGRHQVLSGIDLSVPAGEQVAVIGPSGGGKSTLIALLQRLYEPTRGSIRIDGIDLRSIKQSSLRRHVGVVLQDPLLFDDTVRANIAYGRPDASMEEILAAAEAANAQEFIDKLEEGYETKVGERGCRLSAGQRQRIAIARVLLKDPRILIMDEATSALDCESEALVHRALERLVRGRTTFVVAHRLATVRNADRILVLRSGKIVEQGSPRELLERNGYYAYLLELQRTDPAKLPALAMG